MTTLTTRRFASRAALDAALAQRLGAALGARGTSAVMLAGGETPLAAYRALARQSLPHGEGLHILFSDERYVPADSADSNYHRARPLLDALGLAPAAIARVRTGLSLEEAAGAHGPQRAAPPGTDVRGRLGLLRLRADRHTPALLPAAGPPPGRRH